jgi:membrane protein required for colicin V production
MNWTDYVIIVLMAFSCAAGLYRGLLREVVSLVTWLLAVLLAWHMAPLLEPHLGGALANEAVRPWAARVIIFIVVMLIGAAVGALVTHFVRLALLGSVDRMLGFLFGFLRGLVVLGLLAMLCHAVRLSDERWYRESTLVPSVEHAANILRALVGESKMRSSEATSRA